MHVELLSARYESAYQDFLRQFESPQFYSSLGYLRLLRQYTGAELKVYLALEKASIVGVLPTMEMVGGAGKVLNSLPYFGSLGGVIATSLESERLLTSHYNELVEGGEYVAATWVENPLQKAMPTIQISHDHKDYRIGQITDLGSIESSEDVFSLIHSSTRRNIRKAVSSSVRTVVDSGDIDTLFEMHCASMAAINGKAKESAFFDSIASNMTPDEDYEIIYATLNGKKIAGILLFFHTNYVEYFTPASLGEYRDIQPTAAILHDAILAAAQNGKTMWNWGGTWQTQEGVYKFKKKWGAKDFHYNYYTKINNSKIYSMSRAELEAQYPHFFVLPYSELKGT